MNSKSDSIHIVGGGLAGSECALQLANKGYKVSLYEMRRGDRSTPAHKTQDFAELVCSNSFGSLNPESAPGQLKWEAEQLNSYVLKAAKDASVPAGQALGIDRHRFSKILTDMILQHPNITVIPKAVDSLAEIPRPAVIATGPLTDSKLANDLHKFLGKEFLYFFDAISPIIDADTIDTNIAWKADRYGKGSADYFNCPMDKDQYYSFVQAIKDAKKVEFKEFENVPYFEGCMPIEEIVRRGDDTARFGPMKPVGLEDPRTGKIPYAVVQLRQDNREATAYSIVGFQTKMTYSEQIRVFRTIPGLEKAEFLKLGSIHRNLYVNALQSLNTDLSTKNDSNLYLAGQIAGVEGYFESTCMGLLVSVFLDQKLKDKPLLLPPRESALGALLYTITKEEKRTPQPTNINFGLFPAITGRMAKDEKKAAQIRAAQEAFKSWIN